MAERAEVREVLNSKRFQDRSPYQVYATLLDEGHVPSAQSARCIAFWMSTTKYVSAGTSVGILPILSRNSWRPRRINCGLGISQSLEGRLPGSFFISMSFSMSSAAMWLAGCLPSANQATWPGSS